MIDIKELEKRLLELSTSFIILFDNLKKEGTLSQEEYNTHTMLKKEFVRKFKNNTDN